MRCVPVAAGDRVPAGLGIPAAPGVPAAVNWTVLGMSPGVVDAASRLLQKTQ